MESLVSSTDAGDDPGGSSSDVASFEGCFSDEDIVDQAHAQEQWFQKIDDGETGLTPSAPGASFAGAKGWVFRLSFRDL